MKTEITLSSGRTISLTEREVAMLNLIVNNDYNSGDPEGETWDFVVGETRGNAAVFGSLVKKGLAYTRRYDRNNAVGLTGEGREAYATLFPSDPTPEPTPEPEVKAEPAPASEPEPKAADAEVQEDEDGAEVILVSGWNHQTHTEEFAGFVTGPDTGPAITLTLDGAVGARRFAPGAAVLAYPPTPENGHNGLRRRLALQFMDKLRVVPLRDARKILAESELAKAEAAAPEVKPASQSAEEPSYEDAIARELAEVEGISVSDARAIVTCSPGAVAEGLERGWTARQVAERMYLARGPESDPDGGFARPEPGVQDGGSWDENAVLGRDEQPVPFDEDPAGLFVALVEVEVASGWVPVGFVDGPAAAPGLERSSEEARLFRNAGNVEKFAERFARRSEDGGGAAYLGITEPVRIKAVRLEDSGTVQTLALDDARRSVLMETSAPEVYDGFGTHTVAVIGHCRRSRNLVRRVRVLVRHFDWQVNRYASGMHLFTTERRRAEDLVQFGDWTLTGTAEGTPDPEQGPETEPPAYLKLPEPGSRWSRRTPDGRIEIVEVLTPGQAIGIHGGVDTTFVRWSNGVETGCTRSSAWDATWTPVPGSAVPPRRMLPATREILRIARQLRAARKGAAARYATAARIADEVSARVAFRRDNATAKAVFSKAVEWFDTEFGAEHQALET